MLKSNSFFVSAAAAFSQSIICIAIVFDETQVLDDESVEETQVLDDESVEETRMSGYGNENGN